MLPRFNPTILDEQIKEEHDKIESQMAESEEFLPPERGCFDLVDELFLPLANQELISAHNFEERGNTPARRDPFTSQFLLSDEPILDRLDGLNEEKVEVKEENILQRISILNVINNFSAFNQSLAIVMNFHSLLKKDTATKMYGSILGVLNKESRKMENALGEELK
jgi:hypothetical protein